MKPTVVHMTTVHPPSDTRIFIKICRSLADAGYRVHLVAAWDGDRETEFVDGVLIHYVSPEKGRLRRAALAPLRVLRKAETIDADIYHFHDPEMIPFGLWFQRKMDRPVVYDAHEDLRLDILDKEWIPGPARRLVSLTAGLIEDFAASRLAAVIATRKSIEDHFARRAKCVPVRNYPIKSELVPIPAESLKPRRTFVYVGGIFAIRGIVEMIEALPLAGPDATLCLAGNWESDRLRDQCRRSAGWRQTVEMGFLDRAGVRAMLNEALAGLVMFYPIGNHLKSEPTKMFEYMSASVPLIASDLPHWRGIVEDIGCGLLRDPKSPDRIAEAMRWYLDNPKTALEMGKRGRDAIEKEFNWENEFSRLDRLYTELTARLK